MAGKALGLTLGLGLSWYLINVHNQRKREEELKKVEKYGEKISDILFQFVEGESSVVAADVVFIHGLQTTHINCWVSKQPSIVGNLLHGFWPSEWLPSKIAAGSRVFGLRYDSLIRDFNNLNFDDIGVLLLHYLGTQRIGEKGRPMVLIGVDFGGILAKAIVRTAMTHPHYKSKGITVGGVLFLGTPHREDTAASSFSSIFSKLLASQNRRRELIISERVLHPIRELSRNYWKTYGDSILNESIGPTDESGPIPRRLIDVDIMSDQIRHNYIPLPSYQHDHIGKPTSEQDIRFLSVVSFINEAFRFGAGSFSGAVQKLQ